MSEQILYRDESPGDFAAVAAIVSAAFGQQHEADIVCRVRETPARVLSMVAQRDLDVVAHVLFSRVHIGVSQVRACALGPVAVKPIEQGRGVGTALINAALDRLRGSHFELVFVLGNPRYYARFDFENAARHGYHYQSADFDRAFQVRAMNGSIPSVANAWVNYPDAFD